MYYPKVSSYTLIYSTRSNHCITSKTITLVFFAIEVFTLYETLLLYYQAFLSQSAPLAERHAGGDKSQWAQSITHISKAIT